MSEFLPLFPLPTVVLFPNVFLPLHIFEPRYREMVTDALASDRLIGMVLLRPGWETSYAGHPAVYPIGCSGVITHVEQLADGRYNIVLRGIERFRVLSEERDRSYRRGLVEWLRDEPLKQADHAAMHSLRSRLEALIAPPSVDRSGTDIRTASGMNDEDLVNALAQYLDLDPIERQALLEQDGVRRRAESLLELLEMKVLIARTPGCMTNVAH
jgi:Lon protease-like protein